MTKQEIYRKIDDFYGQISGLQNNFEKVLDSLYSKKHDADIYDSAVCVDQKLIDAVHEISALLEKINHYC